jgi:hypothetical protein
MCFDRVSHRFGAPDGHIGATFSGCVALSGFVRVDKRMDDDVRFDYTSTVRVPIRGL